MEQLEPALLRTFLAAVEAGGVMRAAGRVGRTRAAVSQQMQRLQETVGRPLFRKVGRRLELTPTGEALAGWARRLLTLNDQALAALREADAPELIRVGAPQDVVERWLPPVLSRFAGAHPAVRLELVVGHSRVLAEQLVAGRLELCVRFALAEEATGKTLGSARVRLFAANGFSWRDGNPLPLALLEPPCVFRSALLQALDGAGIAWRLAVSCPSVSALWASVAAGLGVTARMPIGAPRGVRPWQLPGVGALPRALLTIDGGAARSAAVGALRRDIESELRGRLKARAGQA